MTSASRQAAGKVVPTCRILADAVTGKNTLLYRLYVPDTILTAAESNAARK